MHVRLRHRPSRVTLAFDAAGCVPVTLALARRVTLALAPPLTG
ncbi:hypothetical protein [Thermobispora bispora]|nr:hypothetical protein [Thermobispora bispora]MDI9581652.1 hypothetical protein [Thermobispora sp.]